MHALLDDGRQFGNLDQTHRNYGTSDGVLWRLKASVGIRSLTSISSGKGNVHCDLPRLRILGVNSSVTQVSYGKPFRDVVLFEMHEALCKTLQTRQGPILDRSQRRELQFMVAPVFPLRNLSHLMPLPENLLL